MSISEEIKTQDKKVVLEFGGQGAPFLKELGKLYGNGELAGFFRATFDKMASWQPVIAGTALYEHGLDIEKWLSGEDVPDDEYLMRANISIVGIMITQSATFYSFLQKGVSLDELQGKIAGGMGHSQGVIAAVMAAVCKSQDDFMTAYGHFLDLVFYLGMRAQECWPDFAIKAEDMEMSAGMGDKTPSPMSAVIGYSHAELDERIAAVNAELAGDEKIYGSLYNTPDSVVISGSVGGLLLFRKKYLDEMNENKRKFVYLKTTAPFHSPYITAAKAPFLQDMRDFPYSSSDLAFPVYSFYDGGDFRDADILLEKLFDEVAVLPLYWKKAVDCAAAGDMVLDFGPGATIQKLTQANQESGKPVYCLSNPRDLKLVY